MIPTALPRIYRSNCSGFSLIELLVVLALLGIILSLGASNLASWVANHRIEGIQDRLMRHIQIARAHALNHSVWTVICPRNGDVCGDTTDWTNGWLVFEDRIHSRTLDADDLLLESTEYSGNDSATVSIRFDDRRPYLWYKPNGTAWPGATFRICPQNDLGSGAGITISPSGRPRFAALSDVTAACKR